MAQDTTPIADDPATGEDKRPGFHYYSGGEVKELENTRVSPLLWVFWTVVIIGAIGYLAWGGALGPHSPISTPYIPSQSTPQAQAQIQQEMNQQMFGNETAQMADMRRLTPFLGGESLTMAIQHGSNTYQSYCIGCHGPNQDGNGVNAASLNPKPRNLHDGPFMRETLNYQRINTSVHYGVHGTAMPRWENTLTEHEIQEVIAYVLSLTWNMPPSSDMDTTTQQLATPPAMTSPKVDTGTAGTGKSPSDSTTGTPGGSSVQGGSVSTSPAPITPAINGNPAAETSTAPPSQSGQPEAVNPIAPQPMKHKAHKAPAKPHVMAPAGTQPGYVMPGGTQ